MKNSILKITGWGLILLLGFTSCEDFLDADNKSKVAASEQFSTEDGFETLVNEAYYELRSVYGVPDIYCYGTDLYTGVRSYNDKTLIDYTLTSDNSTVEDFYTDVYAAIDAANAVLYYADDCEDYDDKDLRLQEARFIRAYAYYILSQQFGGVPLVTDYIASAETSYPRNTLEETYDLLISELTELSDDNTLLPESDNTGRASKEAAQALLAKVYLAAGWDLGTSLTSAADGTYSVDDKTYFEKADSTAQLVCNAISIGSGSQSFEEKWSPDNEQNDEIIFSIQYDRSTALDQVEGGHTQQNYFGTYLGSVTAGMKYVSSNYQFGTKTYYLYNEDDERYNATFMTTVYNYYKTWGTQGYWAYYNATSSVLDTLVIADYYPAWYKTADDISAYQTEHASQFVRNGASNVCQIIHTADPVRWIIYSDDGSVSSDVEYDYSTVLTKVSTIPPIKKFDDKDTDADASTGSGSYRDFVLLDASDIYLVAAEAKLMEGDESSALEYINDLRERAGASTLSSFSDYQRYDPDEGDYVSADQDIDVILDERARELLGEYDRWMDLRRTCQLVRYNIRWNEEIDDVSDMEGSDGNIKWYRPIPADEISLNTGISSDDQNPGY